MSLRNEAHRFAISYHRLLRDKRIVTSELDDILGVGKEKKKSLIKYFGSVESIKQSSVAELILVPGINKALAEKILESLRK